MICSFLAPTKGCYLFIYLFGKQKDEGINPEVAIPVGPPPARQVMFDSRSLFT